MGRSRPRLALTTLAVTVLCGDLPRPGASHGMPPIAFYLTLFPLSLLNGLANVAMLGGPLNEEGGWRGWLLPRLVGPLGPVRASLVVGAIWAGWHLPLMILFPAWRDGIAFWTFLPLYVVWTMGVACVLTEIWARARESLLPCIWLHGIVNALGSTAFAPRFWTNRFSDHLATARIIGEIEMILVFVLTAVGLRWMRRWPILSR